MSLTTIEPLLVSLLQHKSTIESYRGICEVLEHSSVIESVRV